MSSHSDATLQVNVYIKFSVSNAIAIDGVDVFFVLLFIDLECDDDVWELIEDVVPEYEKLLVTQVRFHGLGSCNTTDRDVD